MTSSQDEYQVDSEQQAELSQNATSARALPQRSFSKLAESLRTNTQLFLKCREWTPSMRNVWEADHQQEDKAEHEQRAKKQEQVESQERSVAPFHIGVERPTILDAPIEERAGQYCILCLGKDWEQHAVAVPCYRPTEYCEWTPTDHRERGPSTEVARQSIQSGETVCESDTAIFERLKSACFEHDHGWKRWLPFYGVTNVQEVTFQFVGVINKDGRYPIRITPLDLDKVKQQMIALQLWNPEDRCNSFDHSSRCEDNMVDGEFESCIVEDEARAQRRLKRLSELDLLTHSAADPAQANGLRLLEGMAAESCIYKADRECKETVWPIPHRPYNRVDRLRGLHYTLGWQVDRLRIELPRNMLWSYLGVVVVWLCVLVWAVPGGDWSIAMAFGQLVAACVALLVLYTK